MPTYADRSDDCKELIDTTFKYLDNVMPVSSEMREASIGNDCAESGDPEMVLCAIDNPWFSHTSLQWPIKRRAFDDQVRLSTDTCELVVSQQVVSTPEIRRAKLSIYKDADIHAN